MLAPYCTQPTSMARGNANESRTCFAMLHVSWKKHTHQSDSICCRLLWSQTLARTIGNSCLIFSGTMTTQHKTNGHLRLQAWSESAYSRHDNHHSPSLFPVAVPFSRPESPPNAPAAY